MYGIEYSLSATKDIKHLPKVIVVSVVKKIEMLAANPRGAGSVKLKGYRNLYRVRQGDYRIIYKIEDGQLLVVIIEVGNRRDIYRKY